MSENQIIKTSLPLKDLIIFSEFLKEIRYKNRFFLDDASEKFCNNIIKYAKMFKTREFIKGEQFYRARIYEFNSSAHFSIDVMSAPPPEKATHGRLNPVGIPYLYLANNSNTAIAEVRPWVGCNITIAKFVLNRTITLINFSSALSLEELNKMNFEKYEGAELTWRELISWLFSAPFDPRDDTAYMATQYLAEKIKKEGFDGILYDSALASGGYNIALFDKNNASADKLYKASVKRISYENEILDIKD
ncbi:MAG: RES family NAD+ phosphorylase [Deltaproteobacteria bacterium]|nr:RES family NAD+ phosphorylase [Deltaproteobacteria bacterium]